MLAEITAYEKPAFVYWLTCH